MENLKENISNLYNSTFELGQLHTKVLRLEIYERLTNLISSGISAAVIALFSFFAFMLLNFGLGYYLGQKLDSIALGFVIIAGFYCILIIIYIVLKNKTVDRKLKNQILSKLSKNINDFDELLLIQKDTYERIDIKKDMFTQQINLIKQDIGFDEPLNKKPSVDNNEHNQNLKFPRTLVTGLVDLVLKKVVLRKYGVIAKTVVPIIANAAITSKIFKEDTAHSFIENLKLKLSK